MVIKKSLPRLIACFFSVFALLSCSSSPKLPAIELPPPSDGEVETVKPPSTPSPKADNKQYYLDDGPPTDTDAEMAASVVDAIPRWEPISPARNRPYTALGNRYEPYKTLRSYRQRGIASWYGRRYHGRKTASGETYDMFGMTAAHPILPIPSYVRVTRVATGGSVVLRVNDRGPFLGGRLIDLSYAAAARLGFVKDGTTEVIVELIIPPGAPDADLSPSSESPSPPPPPKAAVPAATSGIYIQLAAYSSRNAAVEMLDRLQQEIPAALAKRALMYTADDGLFFVQIGPYPTREAAVIDDQTLCDTYGHCGFLKGR